MAVKNQALTNSDEQHSITEIITVDTPNPQEIAPPPEALVASQPTIETNEVAFPVVVVEVLHNAVIDPIASSIGSNLEPPKYCTVIAPSSLQAGYSFPAIVDGIDFIVTVPEGGIREGQAFQVPYPSTPATRREPLAVEQSTQARQLREDDVMGRWRSPLCECCEVCENGMCCCGFFCFPLVLAQVMTRLKLNVIGIRGQNNLYHRTFWWVLGFWALFLVLFFCFASLNGVSAVALCIFGVYYTVASTNVRATIRRRYDINTECCDGVVDDCCTSLWCTCCSALQMARQTHDPGKYPYKCCTKTGLDPSAPDIV